MKSIQKILVVRFSSIGDIVLTTPVVRILKKQLNIEPQAEGAYGKKTLPISTYTSRQKLVC